MAVGITNQREATTTWGKNTDEPVYNAFVWQDARIDDIVHEIVAGDPLGVERYRQITDENISIYPPATKVEWILDNVGGTRERVEAEDLLSGTPDTRVLRNLTGGVNSDIHATDVTNVLCTLLIDVRELRWREDICEDFDISMPMSPGTKPSITVYDEGCPSGLSAGVLISGILGDQRVATFGQAYFEPGVTKNTYDTGCFALMSTGIEPVFSENDPFTTVLYQFGDEASVYAFGDFAAIAGSLVQ